MTRNLLIMYVNKSGTGILYFVPLFFRDLYVAFDWG